MNKMKTILIIVTLIILLIIGFVSFDVLKHIRFKGQISGTLLEPNYPGGLLSPNNDQSLNTTDSVTFGTLDISGTTTLATTDGNVGIGTTTPSSLLHLNSGTTSNPPLKLTDGDLLSTPEVGSVEFSNGRFYITSVEKQRAIDRSSDVLLTTQTVVSTTTETTVITDTLDGGILKVGNFTKVLTSGKVSSASASDVVILRVKLGGSTIASSTSPGKQLTNDCIKIDGHSTVRTTGATGTMAYWFDIQIEDEHSSFCGTSTIDTTTDNDITITAQWNNAKVDNELNISQSIFEFKN